MKKIIYLSLLTLTLSGCANLRYFDDFESRASQPMTFQVRQVALDEVIASNPAMGVRKEILAGNKPANADVQTGDEVFRVSTELLNIRSEADADSEKVGELTLGQEVDLVEMVEDEAGNSWAKISHEGKAGFVLAEYLTSGEVKKPLGIYRSVIYVLNVRSGPSEDADILGELGYFEEFEVYGDHTDENGDLWLETMYAGQKAYVLSDYCVELE